MKKLRILSALIFASYQAFAQPAPIPTTICTAMSPSTNNQYIVQINDQKNIQTIEINGSDETVHKILSSDFSKIGDLLKCEITSEDFEDCYNKYFGGNSGNQEYTEPHLDITLMQTCISIFEQKFSFDLSKIYSGIKYVIAAKPTEISSDGLSEFFDAKGNHLGYTLIYKSELMECSLPESK